MALVNATKDLVDPKLGTILTELYENFIRDKDTSLGLSVPEVEVYIAVDIFFTPLIDNAQAKEVLTVSTVIVQVVDFMECFACICSVRLPVGAWKDISRLDSEQLLRSVQATTNIGSVTSEGDLAMFSNLVHSRYGVNGSVLLIGFLFTSYNCLGNAAIDIASGDFLPSGTNRILVLLGLSVSECSSFGGSDEGRAMMQLVYDVSPGVRLASHGLL
jgi:hypothetical protein